MHIYICISTNLSAYLGPLCSKLFAQAVRNAKVSQELYYIQGLNDLIEKNNIKLHEKLK